MYRCDGITVAGVQCRLISRRKGNSVYYCHHHKKPEESKEGSDLLSAFASRMGMLESGEAPKVKPRWMDDGSEYEKPKYEKRKPKTKFEKFLAGLPDIDPDFTTTMSMKEQRDAHARAVEFLKKHLRKEVPYHVGVKMVSPPEHGAVEYAGQKLNPEVFTWEYTKDVTQAIQDAGDRDDEDTIYIFTAASQYNGGEAPDRLTIPTFAALPVYKKDRTQGPAAQRAFSPLQVEIINCAANIGLNGLCDVLDEETKSAVAHGYFTPTGKNILKVLAQLRTAGHRIQFLCVESIPRDRSERVHLMLTAAPAFGRYRLPPYLTKEQETEVVYLCALLSFRAQFHHAVDLATKYDKKVVLKATGVGLGVFENDPKIVGKAFVAAAAEFEQDLLETGSEVRFQLFNPSGAGKTYGNDAKMAEFAGLQQYTK